MPRQGQIKMYRPVPNGFPDAFVRLGWRGIEEHYHAHARSIKRWLEICGREQLIALRAEYVRQRYEERRTGISADGDETSTAS